GDGDLVPGTGLAAQEVAQRAALHLRARGGAGRVAGGDGLELRGAGGADGEVDDGGAAHGQLDGGGLRGGGLPGGEGARVDGHAVPAGEEARAGGVALGGAGVHRGEV